MLKTDILNQGSELFRSLSYRIGRFLRKEGGYRPVARYAVTGCPLFFFAIFFFYPVSLQAQTDCPADRVCLDREQAIEYLSLKDVNDALKKEIATLQQAIDGHKAIIVDLKVELARMSGEKSQLEADRVRTNAIMDILIKQARPKKVGLINLF